MHFVTEAVPAEILAQMTRLVAITGWKPWRRRLEWVQEQVRSNPTMPSFLHERFGLELAFAQVRRHQNRSGRYPWPPQTAEQQRLYSLLAMVTRCHHRLGPVGKNRLKGMIADALKSDYGFAPLAFEMKIAAHLMSKGLDVIFHDIEEGGGFDYLIENDGVAVEIECKFVSGDIGRQIHLKKFHQLSTVLLPEMSNFLDQGCGGRLIRIVIPGRLGGDDKQYQQIRRLMSQAFFDQMPNATAIGYEVSISEFSMEASPFGQSSPSDISMVDVVRFLSNEFGIENKNVLIQGNPKKGVILVVVESTKKDAVLKGIHHQLKGAARGQFSGNRPGIVCCELADLTEDQLRSLAKDREGGTGLQYMVSDLIARRPQIHTVTFTTPGTVRIEKSKLATSMHTSVQETGPACTFTNASHPLVNDPRCDVF